MRRALLVVGLSLLGLGAAAVSDRALNASIRHLRSAVRPQNDGGHLLLLQSLRQLRDPSLRAFFLQLAQNSEPQTRIHAILGLAEIDPTGHVDPWLISQFDSPDARYVTIDSAIRLELIDTPQMKELLGWEDLEAKARVLLLAQIMTRDEPVDRQVLAGLAGHPELDVAGLVACLLAQLGNETALEAYNTRLEATPEANRNVVLRELFAAIAIYRLTAIMEWVAQEISRPGMPPELLAAGVSTLLALDPDRGVAAWTQTLGPDPPHATRVRYALLLLRAGPAVPVTAFDRMPDDDPLLAAMANAGRARASGTDVAAALIELSDLGHRATMVWATTVASDLDDDQAARLYAHLIDTAEAGDPRSREARIEAAFVAASRLFDIDPDAVLTRLDRAPDNGLTQESILLGLLETTSPAAGTAARQVPRTGFSRADSLATILIAKHTQQLTPAELEQLGAVAAGGGRISEVLRAQAAWLYLRHAGRTEQALVDVFTPSDSP